MVTARSQNGYTVLGQRYDGPLPRLRRWQVPGSRLVLPLRDGSTGFLLVHWAHWFNSHVENLSQGQPDDWGYAARPIRGSKEWSNHASGTAVDLNATRHPLGKRGTFPARDVARIRRQLWAPEGYAACIYWGGDYDGRADEMHFEINRPLEACEEAAARLLLTARGRLIATANPGSEAVITS